MQTTSTRTATACYHCGEDCNEEIVTDGKHFCCRGCEQVYLLLNENNLCGYYDFENSPGIKAKGRFASGRFAYLDDEQVIRKLVQFSSDTQTNLLLQLPQMHCSSCIYLLENLHRIEPGIIKSQAHFQRKEVFIIFNPSLISLRKVVELLAFIGYEPYISLQDTREKTTPRFNRKRIYKIGVAGFAFSNIMMLSFPEYFSSGHIEQEGLKLIFTWLSLFLSLPVLFYSAGDFFTSAWKGLRQRFLNIDAPIALAIVVTYARSYYEIVSGTGAGYLDSGTGIVFFMLVGRWFQDKTYDSFSFDRDYLSYFPLGVTVMNNGEEKNIPVTQLKKGDHILVRHEEMVPADAVLLQGDASVDYSFVSGENTPVTKRKGELIYAGGKQLGGAIELEVVHETSQSYITQLWNNEVFSSQAKNADKSYIHPWSRYFTLVLFTVAATTAVYWSLVQPERLWPAVTAVLIVACPCSLLLSATFTYGNMLRIFGRNKMYLKNSSVIEAMAAVNSLVLDKTGTLTQPHSALIRFEGAPLTAAELAVIKAVTRQSAHPLSQLIAAQISAPLPESLRINGFREISGKGIEARVNDLTVKIGSAGFLEQDIPSALPAGKGTHVHLMLGNRYRGMYVFSNRYRDGIEEMAGELSRMGYALQVLSGDNDAEKTRLQEIFGQNTTILFNQQPQDKLNQVRRLQEEGRKVLMLGDGLNDAGALRQADAGIAVSDNNARFTPASDAILDGNRVHLLPRFLAFARSGRKIVTASFVLSILYNFVGLSFAVQGTLSPMIAAILMPASSISIVILVSLLSSLSARRKGL